MIFVGLQDVEVDFCNVAKALLTAYPTCGVETAGSYTKVKSEHDPDTDPLSNQASTLFDEKQFTASSPFTLTLNSEDETKYGRWLITLERCINSYCPGTTSSIKTFIAEILDPCDSYSVPNWDPVIYSDIEYAYYELLH